MSHLGTREVFDFNRLRERRHWRQRQRQGSVNGSSRELMHQYWHPWTTVLDRRTSQRNDNVKQSASNNFGGLVRNLYLRSQAALVEVCRHTAGDLPSEQVNISRSVTLKPARYPYADVLIAHAMKAGNIEGRQGLIGFTHRFRSATAEAKVLAWNRSRSHGYGYLWLRNPDPRALLSSNGLSSARRWRRDIHYCRGQRDLRTVQAGPFFANPAVGSQLNGRLPRVMFRAIKAHACRGRVYLGAQYISDGSLSEDFLEPCTTLRRSSTRTLLERYGRQW